MTDFRALLQALNKEGVDFILVGGAAAIAHGSVRLTLDLDVVYSRHPRSLKSLVEALAPSHPYLRKSRPDCRFYGIPKRYVAD